MWRNLTRRVELCPVLPVVGFSIKVLKSIKVDVKVDELPRYIYNDSVVIFILWLESSVRACVRACVSSSSSRNNLSCLTFQFRLIYI